MLLLKRAQREYMEGDPTLSDQVDALGDDAMQTGMAVGLALGLTGGVILGITFAAVYRKVREAT